MKFLKWKRHKDKFTKEIFWTAKSCIEGVVFKVSRDGGIAKRLYKLNLTINYVWNKTNESAFHLCSAIEGSHDAICIAPAVYLARSYAQFFDNILNQRYKNGNIRDLSVETARKFIGNTKGGI